LSSVGVTMTATGQDGKQYEMICIPLSYLNGWLFRINPARYEGKRRDPATVQRIIDQMLEIDKICPFVLNNVRNYVSTALETSRNMAQR